jgi:hypothetical protein
MKLVLRKFLSESIGENQLPLKELSLEKLSSPNSLSVELVLRKFLSG